MTEIKKINNITYRMTNEYKSKNSALKTAALLRKWRYIPAGFKNAYKPGRYSTHAEALSIGAASRRYQGIQCRIHEFIQING